MKKYIILVLTFFSFQFSWSQETISASDVPTFSTAGQGDLYVDENGVHYIGLQSGALQLLSDFKPKEISNELLFQDNDYYYVSMQVYTNDYLVVRYDKTDVNTETRAVGTGTQPSTLAGVQGLTYN